ncbi:MAG: hypothetical protein ACLSD6_06290 [Clostridium sp.]
MLQHRWQNGLIRMVQVIGRKIVLNRESKTKKKIELPKAKNTKE